MPFPWDFRIRLQPEFGWLYLLVPKSLFVEGIFSSAPNFFFNWRDFSGSEEMDV
jgi:hypothetical protein